MSGPTTVNPQILDAVDQTAKRVFEQASAVALGSLFQTESQAMSNVMHNNTAIQQAMQQLNVAVISTSVAAIVAAAPRMETPSSSGGEDPSSL